MVSAMSLLQKLAHEYNLAVLVGFSSKSLHVHFSKYSPPNVILLEEEKSRIKRINV